MNTVHSLFYDFLHQCTVKPDDIPPVTMVETVAPFQQESTIHPTTEQGSHVDTASGLVKRF